MLASLESVVQIRKVFIDYKITIRIPGIHDESSDSIKCGARRLKDRKPLTKGSET